MHESMGRLYKAAKQLKGVEGQTPVATLLSESPQTVNNWETRGISAKGAAKAQANIGCDANWLLTGHGSMLAGWPFPKVPVERFLALEEPDRGYVQRKLFQSIRECEVEAPEEPATAPDATEADHAVLDESVRATNKTFRNKRKKKEG